MTTTKKLLFLFSLLFLFQVKLVGQGEFNIWYFGVNAGMDFNGGPPVALTDGALSTSEGCASISNNAGGLLFYTDGSTVWNKVHLTMPNGTGLLGNASSTQSAIIVPKPGSSTKYYIFTVEASGGPNGLNYSEVDMTLAAGLGDVTATKNIPLHTPVCEKITAVKQANNIDYWVLVHDYATNLFLAYSVTSAGVNPVAVNSNTGSVDGSFGIGCMKASADGSKIVQAIYVNTIDVLNFDNLTGIVTLDFTITTPFDYPYGLEFSMDGKRLYAGGTIDQNVYQYDMTLPTPAAISASLTSVGVSAFGGYICTLQMAPDGKIYIAKDGDFTLSCINNPNVLGAGCGFVDNAVNLLGKISQYGLPNFIPSLLISSSITYTNTCVGDTTFFSLQDSITVDSILWNFGDPGSGSLNTSTSYYSNHIYPSSGTYNVYAVTYIGSVVDTITTTLTINSAPLVSIGNDTSVCVGASVLLDAGAGYTYLWQDLSTNQTFNATAAGTYYVDVTNVCGTTTDTIIITSLPTPVVVVNDVSICIGQTANLSASGASSYTWSAGATVTGASTASATPTTTTTYTITGTSSGCSSNDIATVTVNPLPTPNFTASVTSGCAPLCVQFNETASTSCSSLLYNFGNGASSTASSPLYCYADSGSYTVDITCTDINGCIGSTSVVSMINVFSNPTASFSMSPSGVTSPNTPVVFQNTSTGGTISAWTFDDIASGASNFSALFSPTHTYSDEGSYCATLITFNAAGCSDTASLCIEVVKDIELPNVFTPNGDGTNEAFYIKNLQAGFADLKIYNRWGNLIFSSDAYDNNWKAENVEDGVYYYVMYYPKNKKTYTGFVQIIHRK